MTIHDNSRIAVSKDQVWCLLGDDAAVLNLKSGIYYGLDPVGVRIWNLLQDTKTLAELRALLLAEYDADETQIDADVRNLLTELAEQGLVQITE